MSLRLAASAAFALFASASFALTLEPLPGSTSQVTNVGAFFPVDIGAIVRDDNGEPLAGVTVHFEVMRWEVGSFPNAGDITSAVSDANGMAVPNPNMVAGNSGYSGQVVASAEGAANTVAYDLAVTGVLPSAMAVLSGQSQWTRVGQRFPDPIVVQVFTPNRTPVPYAAVLFYLRPDAVPSGVFDGGSTSLFVKAGPDGVARAPGITANFIVGQEKGSASAQSDTDNRDYLQAAQLFKYKLVP